MKTSLNNKFPALIVVLLSAFLALSSGWIHLNKEIRDELADVNQVYDVVDELMRDTGIGRLDNSMKNFIDEMLDGKYTYYDIHRLYSYTQKEIIAPLEEMSETMGYPLSEEEDFIIFQLYMTFCLVSLFCAIFLVVVATGATVVSILSDKKPMPLLMIVYGMNLLFGIIFIAFHNLVFMAEFADEFFMLFVPGMANFLPLLLAIVAQVMMSDRTQTIPFPAMNTPPQATPAQAMPSMHNQQTQGMGGAVPPSGIPCGGCGHVNASDGKFCRSCGTPLATAPVPPVNPTVFCQSCGEANSSSGKFCKKCGVPFS